MNKHKFLAGIDAGHINTKVVIVKNREILGRCTMPTGFDVAAAVHKALDYALKRAGISCGDLSKITATGIFKDMISVPALEVSETIPVYKADAQGALFLDNKSRTVIDIGGNILKAICYDPNGHLLDVIENDKCADGLGIFFTAMAEAVGFTEQQLSESALKSTHDLSIAVQCALSAESDVIDLLCRGMAVEDVADAALKFIVERVADMCTTMRLAPEIVAMGGLAKSQAIVAHLRQLIKQEVTPLNYPEYVGAIGAAIHCEEGK